MLGPKLTGHQVRPPSGRACAGKCKLITCPVQVINHSWVVTRGGLVPKLLNPNVARGAANVASVRRLRNLVHGAIALKSLRALKVCSRVRIRACTDQLYQIALIHGSGLALMSMALCWALSR